MTDYFYHSGYCPPKSILLIKDGCSSVITTSSIPCHTLHNFDRSHNPHTKEFQMSRRIIRGEQEWDGWEREWNDTEQMYEERKELLLHLLSGKEDPIKIILGFVIDLEGNDTISAIKRFKSEGEFDRFGRLMTGRSFPERVHRECLRAMCDALELYLAGGNQLGQVDPKTIWTICRVLSLYPQYPREYRDIQMEIDALFVIGTILEHGDYPSDHMSGLVGDEVDAILWESTERLRDHCNRELDEGFGEVENNLDRLVGDIDQFGSARQQLSGMLLSLYRRCHHFFSSQLRILHREDQMPNHAMYKTTARIISHVKLTTHMSRLVERVREMLDDQANEVLERVRDISDTLDFDEGRVNFGQVLETFARIYDILIDNNNDN